MWNSNLGRAAMLWWRRLSDKGLPKSSCFQLVSSGIHQALRQSEIARGVQTRNELSAMLAAEGYAWASGRPGVCIAAPDSGARNLVAGLADAMLDAVPLVVITTQAPHLAPGALDSREPSVVEVTRSVTKTNYLVLDAESIPRIVSEAFVTAQSGRPGPVLINIPEEIQQKMVVPNWDQDILFGGHLRRPDQSSLDQIIQMVSESKHPVVYAGSGCLNSSLELRRFVESTGIPVAWTLTGIGCYPCSDDYSLQMLEKNRNFLANYAAEKSDLLLAFGIPFDDGHSVGMLKGFSPGAKIVHIDSGVIGRYEQPHVSMCADIKLVLRGLNSMLEKKGKGDASNLDFSNWTKELMDKKMEFPLCFETFEDAIAPQYAIQILDELTGGNAIITTGAEPHQMWAAQFYKYNKPRQFLTSRGLGAYRFALPAAIGAAIARPNDVVVSIESGIGFMRNEEELATIRENVPVKIMFFNEGSGMLTEARDWFQNPSTSGDVLRLAEDYGIPAARVAKEGDLEAAMLKMLGTPGPYLLDVIVSSDEELE